MISVTELRAGTTYEEDGQYLVVIAYEHIKMGRGSANIKVKVKNLKTGSIIDKSYINGAKVKPASVLKKEMLYLYKDELDVFFMNESTYDQINIAINLVPDHIYLQEGKSFSVSFLEGKPISVLLPPKMIFKIVDTSPGAKGNSATNVFKEAILENGIKTKVPLFIRNGDLIKIDTRTGAYTEKAVLKENPPS